MRRTALFLTFAAAIGLTGCSSETSGDASQEETSNGGSVPSFPKDTPTDTPTAPSADPSVGSESGTADLQPCELLNANDLTALELPGEENRAQDVGLGRACQWQTSGSHTVTVAIFDELGIGDVVSAQEPEPVDVGSHEAVQYFTGGTCAVAIGVSDSSRVDVMGTANGDLTRGCQVATEAAQLVETKLP